MSPTKTLRFVNRYDKVILQQWWSPDEEYDSNGEVIHRMFNRYRRGEWRDISVEKEEENETSACNL